MESLILEQVVFEVRFSGGYLYWDNCGKIWAEILGKHPKLKAESVGVQSAVLVMDDEEITLKFSLDNINISQKYPENLKTFGEFTESTINIIVEYLQVKTFNRVGNRFFFITKVKDSEESVELLKKTGFFAVPEDKKKIIGDSLTKPHIQFHITRGDEIGYMFNLQYMDRKIEVTAPKPITYDTSKFIKKCLNIDIDYYTLKPVDHSIIKYNELIRKNRKDIEYFIEELF